MTRTIVSISDNTDIGRGWRVRTFVQPKSLNELGRTIAEHRFRTETQARKHARDMAISHAAEIQG